MTVIVESFRACFLMRARRCHSTKRSTTIRRGGPDNWGNLFEELQALTASGDWPPAPDALRFWRGT